MKSWAHRFFDLSTQLLAVVDAGGRLVQTNPAWRVSTGWTSEQLEAGTCWHFVHPEDQEALKARLRALGAADATDEFPCRWRCANGTWRELSWSVVSSAAEGLLYCTVTPRDAAWPPPQAASSPLGMLSDDLPFGTYLLEARSGRVLYANARVLQMVGLEPFKAEISRGEFTHERVLELARRGSREPVLEGIRVLSEEDLLHTPTETREVELSGGQVLRRLSSPMRHAGGQTPCQLHVFEDITDSRNLLEAMRRTETSFRALIENLPDGIFVFREDRRFTYVNPTMSAALGHAHPGDLIGQPIMSIIHPDSLPRVRARVANVVAGGMNTLEEIRFLRKDGSAYDTESTSLPIEFDGQPAVAVLSRDITERKRMQAQLLQTDRMAMMGTLAAGVGHEINNPLSYILTNIRLSLENLQRLSDSAAERKCTEALQETREMLQEAHEGGLRVRDIVRDLKLFSRQAEERQGEVEVTRPLEFSLKMAQGQLRHRARIVKRYEPVPTVLADESRLGQVFLNLLLNAAQALPEGEATHHEISLWVRPSVSGGVAVDVTDTGCGISPAVLERIFEPFFTTKPVGMGTGLGLSICHGIVRGLGGELTVRSALGRGSTFTLHLPASPSSRGGPPADRTPSPVPAAPRQGRMLVIDDEPSVARSLARLIGSTHEVLLARSGREGLEYLARRGDFDVVFCDVMMSDATGMDVFEQVRATRPDLARRFIFMTAGSLSPRARGFLDSMPERWLEKPFDEGRLQQLIRDVLLGA